MSELRSSIDRKMDDVHDYREQYGADVVVLLIDDNEACGIAYIDPSPDVTFALMSYTCSTGYFTFGHEIAHTLVSGFF